MLNVENKIVREAFFVDQEKNIPEIKRFKECLEENSQTLSIRIGMMSFELEVLGVSKRNDYFLWLHDIPQAQDLRADRCHEGTP